MWIDTNNKTSPRQAPTEDREMFLNPLQADRKTRPPTRPVQHREAAHPPPLQPGAAKTTDLPADPPTRTACSVPPH